MKKITVLSFAIIGTIALFSISSCKKVWDEIKHHPDGAADNCRIDKVSFRWQMWYDVNDYGPVIVDTAKVTYDSHGDPIKVLYSSSGYTGWGSWHNKAFKYDNQHRLVGYFEDALESLTYGLSWHKYVYNSTNTITDSIFVYTNGDFFNQDRPTVYPGSEFTIYIGKYTLDSYGRVATYQKDQYSNIETYSYNAAGNLITPGVTYTNKTNIKQTHKTWMFITRDYSVNAPEGQATEYNSNKLPVKAKNIDIFPIGYLNAAEGDRQVKVDYLCK